MEWRGSLIFVGESSQKTTRSGTAGEKWGRFTNIQLPGDLRIEKRIPVLGGKKATAISTAHTDSNGKPKWETDFGAEGMVIQSPRGG